LRERVEDIPLLIHHFISLYSERYHKSKLSVSSSTMARLERYHWPGNVRELEHAVERALILSEGSLLRPEDFFLTESEKSKESAGDEMKLTEMEKSAIQKALSKHGGNITQTAKELGLTRTALYRRLEKHGL